MSARRKPAAIGSMPPPPRPSTPHSTHQPQPSQHPPPPSSVAEIVHNYSKTDNDANEYSTRAHLAELFDAIIGSEAGEFREDIATSHKVLETVMNAGLMFTFSKDPLLQIEYILEQVSASLKVIKYFIEKAPASLFCSPPAENSQPNQPHLCLWLLPRLFTLLGNPKTRPLTAMLLEAIEAIFMTVANRPKYWKHLRSMTGYCRESLNCIVTSLQKPTTVNDTLSGAFKIELPRPEFEIGSNIRSDLLSFDSQPVSFNISDVEDAALVAVHIFTMLTSVVASCESIPIMKSLANNITPAQQGLSKIWSTLDIWEPLPIIRDKTVGIRIEVLGALEKALNRTPVLQTPGKSDSLYLFAVRCIESTLNHPADQMNGLSERPLNGILLSLMEASEKSQLISDLAKDSLLPPTVAILADEERWKLLQHDTQVVLSRLVTRTADDKHTKEKATNALNATTGGAWNCKDVDLNRKLKTVLTVAADNGDNSAKRPRLNKLPEYTRLIQTLTSTAFSLLGNRLNITDLAGLSTIAANGFEMLSHDQRCSAVETLGILACAIAGDLHENRSGGEYIRRCSYCDSDQPFLKRKRQYCKTGDAELIATLSALFTLPAFEGIRAWGIDSLRRITNHTLDLGHLDLGHSQLGRYCLGHLDSSTSRALRIAAGRAIPSFVSFTHDNKLVEKNRYIIVEALVTISDSGKKYIQETCVLAWGQFGRISSGNELNAALLRLVEYLGYPHNLVVGVTLMELDELARAHGHSVRRDLMQPFWRSISVPVVRQYQSKPQIVETLISWLGMTMDSFLILTEKFTVPYLVLEGKKEMIRRIGKNSNRTMAVVCHDNMNHIMPVLLIQDVPNVEKHAINLFRTLSKKFDSSSLKELLWPDATFVAAELLIFAGDAGKDEVDRRARAFKALNIVSRLGYRSDDSKLTEERDIDDEFDYMSLFFSQHLLGICTFLTDPKKSRVNTREEKIRCLKGIQEMFMVATKSIGIALPQICAYCQEALESASIRTEGIKTWAILAEILDDEDLAPFLGQTFSVVLHYWSEFDIEAQSIAEKMILDMFKPKKRRAMLERCSAMIPSLENIPSLSTPTELMRLWRRGLTPEERLHQLVVRCSHENVIVVEYALMELRDCIKEYQDFIHHSAGNQKPDPVIAEIIRCLLDVIVTFKEPNLTARPRIERLCAECLGLIGAVNPNDVEAGRVKEDMLILHDFTIEGECAEFVLFFLEKLVVKQLLSATDTKSQGFLAWCAQKLLKYCVDTKQLIPSYRETQPPKLTGAQARWDALSSSVRGALTPLFDSRYSLTGEVSRKDFQYPLFSPDITCREWLNTILTELLCNPAGDGENVKPIFDACSRICKGQDISISMFLFPVAVLHTVISGTNTDRQNITKEFLAVLTHRGDSSYTPRMRNTLQQCVEIIFSVIDHMTKWLRDKRQLQTRKARQRDIIDLDEDYVDPAIQKVRTILDAIPPDLMGQRSLECKSYARSLLYWEQHIRQKRNDLPENDLEPLYEQLQHIYTHIDEPDGMAGISAKLPTLDIDQQILEYRKAGKWTAVQSWYELLIAERPWDVDVQTNLISSLRDSGHYDTLLHQVDSMMSGSNESCARLLPFAIEASWVTSNWEALDKYLGMSNESTECTYDIRMGRALSELRKNNIEAFKMGIDGAREAVAGMMVESSTSSIRQCHHLLVQLHALSELQIIGEELHRPEIDSKGLAQEFESRLNLMGTYSNDKQYILSVRRAALQLTGMEVTEEIASAWLSSAKLARKDDNNQQAYNAVHHATIINSPLATIEHAKLLWHEGQKKNAIRNLNGAIAKKILEIDTEAPLDAAKSTITVNESSKQQPVQNLRVAKAKLLLARWLEASGHTHSRALLEKYSEASKWFQRWEQGHYYLGRHYNKLYEVEKALPSGKQSERFVDGQHARLIVQNYMRALAFGVKYIFQTMPKLLTVWLDLGDDIIKECEVSQGTKSFWEHVKKERERNLHEIHLTTDKYIPNLGAWMFFTALPQLMSRLTHPHKDVYHRIQNMVVKVVVTYPQQSMWFLMSSTKSTQKDRLERGRKLLLKYREALPQRGKESLDTVDNKKLIAETRWISDQLLMVCNFELTTKLTRLSLRKQFKFRHEIAPSQLVLPMQSTLTVTLPSPPDAWDGHTPYAFSSNPPTIHRFRDEVHIMTSLQRPRKIEIEGSDGRIYGFLCKPKDDLRKDARLMEFNNMVNRFFKRDPESSRRNLYIRTYSVTPLNEECGIIEWVDNVSTLREILLHYYKQKEIGVDYSNARILLDDACGHKDHVKKPQVFTDKLLPMFPPVFHEWFLEMFSDPAAWFAARLRYTRTCAVMSIVGTVLGLGDRHGENILFDSRSGDTMHVDFNCLFDKGLGFEKPERVPFRLTHNMVDAFGVTGYEGVYRKASESAMRLLRHNEETMMTVLEAFIHDPSVDMVKRVERITKKQQKALQLKPDFLRPPETPKEILESIQKKLRGLWGSDTLPLSVEGHVEALIKQATDPEFLCAMYIGWCPMF